MYDIIKKLISVFITLLLVSIITFAVFEIIPSDPIAAKLGIEAEPSQIEALRKELGLDLPLHIRYFNWMKNALKGDLGTSIRFDRPVSSLIGERIIVTTQLALISLLITMIIGIPLSIIIAKYNNRFVGVIGSIITQIGMAVPSFWLGIIITYFFGVIMHWFIPGRYVSIEDNFYKGLNYIIFPSIAIAIPRIAVVVRYLRNALVEQLDQDYVRTAYSKGLTVNKTIINHILRNALISVITVTGMIAAGILGGSLIVEQIFGVPGIGRLLIVGITNRDTPLVQGIVLYIGIIVTLINYGVDILYHVIDPRIKLK